MKRIAGAAALALFAVLTLLVALHPAPFGIDASISDWARTHAAGRPGWVTGWRAVTFCGNTLPLTVLFVAATIGYWLRGRRDLAVLVGVSAAGGGLVRLAIQVFLHRQRPLDRLTVATGYSYPSGHSLHALIAGLLVAVLLWHTRWRYPGIAVAVLWGGLVGASRVLLLAHWPTDVLGGWLLAVATVAATAGLVARSRRLRPRPTL